MRNNRSIKIEKDFIQKYNLSVSPPPQNSLFWKMWNQCLTVAQNTLNTAFIQGIKAGNLDPVKYGGFNVSDSYYCFNGAQDYLAAESRATDPTLQAFLLKKYNSYQSYNQTFPDVWHVRDANGVVPTPTVKQYSEFESNIASHEDPIFTLIAMIPCEYLWAWLGGQLAPPISGNIYAPWIKDNNYPDGAYTMGNFLETYIQNNPIDQSKAMQIYSEAMNFEFQNFNTSA